MDRVFDAMELMTDRFDRAATLNFTVVAEVTGPLTTEALVRGLEALQERHPILRAGIDRGTQPPTLLAGRAAPIPLSEEAGDAALAERRLSESLAHTPWPDLGPRGRLHAVHHGGDAHTLLLTLHHTVSDGSSGVIAMRDLLRGSQGMALGAPLPSPGPKHFLPPPQEDAEAQVKAMLAEQAAHGTPWRPRDGEAPPQQRRGMLSRVALSAVQTDNLVNRAKAAGCTVQGLLAAHLLHAVAAELDVQRALMRIGHPVSLRRHIPDFAASKGPIGDAIGYYVSSVDTSHHVDPARPAGELGRDVSSALLRTLELGRHLLSGPVAGAGLVHMTQAMSDEEFRVFCEERVMLSAVGLSNLGVLEGMGVSRDIKSLAVDRMYFANASSIFSALGAGATTFHGRLTLCLRGVSPLINETRFKRISNRVSAAMTQEGAQ